MPARWFRPHIDWWLLVFPVGMLGVMFVLVLVLERGQDRLVGLFITGLGLAVVGGLFWGSGYQVESDRLVVRVGVFRWTVPLEGVHRVRRGGWVHLSSSFRVMRLRGAFSHRNLVLEVKGRFWHEVVVSPADERGFLETLRTYAPHIRIEVTP
ncbi:MAG: PH domain-containing protein [Dehalococcoidia bacterium]|nr:PH domain-containing protein [Dehalococcoidia bacterium]MDW8120671.1 PH domain-containing protein [Chloroflexota bacterium]